MAFSLFAAVSVLAVSDAIASEAPPGCLSGDGARGYNQGYQLESGVVERIWGMFSCNSVEDFVKSVDVGWTPSFTADRFLRCRNIGIGQAIGDKIQEKAVSCGHQCFTTGSEIGELNGKLYCAPPDLSEKSMELSFCSLVSTQACSSTLRSYVQNNCQDRAASDPGFEDYVKRACKL